jgi:isopentenyl-diphosphate Delta-isomerase
MREELGVDCHVLERCLSFVYRAQVAPTLIEHELDHVFVATVHDTPSPDLREVEAWRLVSLEDVSEEVAREPSTFSAWFPLALARLRAAPGTLPQATTAHGRA